MKVRRCTQATATAGVYVCLCLWLCVRIFVCHMSMCVCICMPVCVCVTLSHTHTLSNANLLSNYGFVPTAHNPHDVVLVPPTTFRSLLVCARPRPRMHKRTLSLSTCRVATSVNSLPATESNNYTAKKRAPARSVRVADVLRRSDAYTRQHMHRSSPLVMTGRTRYHRLDYGNGALQSSVVHSSCPLVSWTRQGHPLLTCPRCCGTCVRIRRAASPHRQIRPRRKRPGASVGGRWWSLWCEFCGRVTHSRHLMTGARVGGPRTQSWTRSLRGSCRACSPSGMRRVARAANAACEEFQCRQKLSSPLPCQIRLGGTLHLNMQPKTQLERGARRRVAWLRGSGRFSIGPLGLCRLCMYEDVLKAPTSSAQRIACCVRYKCKPAPGMPTAVKGIPFRRRTAGGKCL